MGTLQGKKIVLGISGGIAAYKTPELVRRLKDQGADVRILMTESAQEFITPLTLQAVSGYAVASSLFDSAAELSMGHIELAKWGDIMLIAPATANTIANIAHGMAHDLLSTLCLATDSPITIAPAMNQQMWHAQATQENVQTLLRRGVTLFGPGQGIQACGDVGLGRMLDVDDLVQEVSNFCAQTFPDTLKTLAGQTWVITAGPTREAIDPVRYISNHSSGKMGYAIAEAAQKLGAKVVLISGPVTLEAPQGCELISVSSALEMHAAALEYAQGANTFIACAAVADYRIAEIAEEKIKKAGEEMQLTLVKNPDIVADIAHLSPKPFTVGFAAETQNVEAYALGKLSAKNLDLIAANNVAIAGQGFNSNNNALTVFGHNSKVELPLNTKKMVAEKLVDLIIERSVALP